MMLTLSPFCWLLRSLSVFAQDGRARRRPRLASFERLESRQLLTTIMSEGFEGIWPGSTGWTVNTSQGRSWDDNSSKSHTGSWSGFSADNSDGSSQSSYLNNMDTRMTKTVDLSDFRNVTLDYWRFVNTEAGFDFFTVTVSKAGVGSVSSTPRSGSLQTWTLETLQIPESLWGQSNVQVEFRFTSDSTVVPSAPSGVWVDDISMDGFNDPGFPESKITTPSGTNLRLNQFGDISNVSGTIFSAGQIDTYGFGVDTSGNYTITVQGSAGLDAQLRIYDAAGNALTPIIDNGFSNGFETFTINLPNSGEACYFQVGGWTTSTGSYTVSVTGPDSFVGSESVPSPAYSVTDSSNIGFAGDRDYFSFTAPFDTTLLSITLDPAATLDSHLTLLDSFGNVLTTADQGFSGGIDSLTDFPITAGTTYVLMVSGFSLAGTGNYDFTIDFNPDNVGDPPSAIAVPAGRNLRLNQFGDISGVFDSIGSTLEFDTFAFGVETTGSYTITAGGGTLDTQLRIYDSNGFAITPIQDVVFNSNPESLTVNLIAGQTCYFVVGGFFNLTGTYNVNVDGPSVVQAATTFASPNYFVTGSGSISGAGDRDYFNITAPANTNLLTVILSPSPNLDGVISLFDAGGTLLQERDVFGDGGAETIASFNVTAGQNYYVVFSGYDISEGAGGALNYNYSLDFGPDLVDINVAPTIPAGQMLQIPENSAANTQVGTVVANDANSTAPNNVLTYQILSGSPSNPFTINASTGAITFNGGALSFETTSQFSLTVKVSDGGTPSLSSTQTVIVSVTDVNEAPSIPAGQVFQVLENSVINTSVGTVSASDLDQVAPNNTLTYSIVSGNPSNPFSINAATGQITVANPAALNFETTPQFTLQVKVTDGGTGNLNATQSVVINLIDANDPPTINAGQIFGIVENSSSGASVGTVLASDPDATAPNKTLTYSIIGGGNTNNAFTINSATGAITVNNPAALDFEEIQSFSLTIQVTDGGSLTAVQGVTVNVSNQNEVPTVTAGQSFSVTENSPAGTVVDTVTATDPDANKTVTFSITGGNTGSAFAIDPATGTITVVGEINFEATAVYSLVVRATDSGNLFDSKTVTVNVINQNEAPKLVLGGDTPTFRLKAKAPVTVFSGITVSDPDGATDLASVTISVSLPSGKRNLDIITANAGALGTLSGSFRNGNVTITLNNGVTVAQVQAFLRSITFSTKGAGAKPINANRNFQVSVTDKNGLSASVGQNLNVSKK